MATEKLRIKLIERRAREFASALKGIEYYEILQLDSAVTQVYKAAISDFCSIGSKPQCVWTHPVEEEEIIDYLCPRICLGNSRLFVPFEDPFTIRVEISDCRGFIKSLWDHWKTKDLSLYKAKPGMLIELQDLEYELAYFEVMVESTLD